VTEAKTQHCVPRFYLDAFCKTKVRKRKPKRVIAVRDLREEKSFPTGLNNVACVNRYYDVAVSDQVAVTVDPGLQRLESLAARAIETLRGSMSIGGLTQTQRGAIALFVTVQSVRGPSLRRSLEAQPKKMLEYLRKLGPIASELEQELESRTPDDATFLHISLIEEVPKLYPLLAGRAWRLSMAPDGSRCCTSDTPVFKYNKHKPTPFGNLGFRSPGVIFELALNPHAILSIAEPEMYDIRDGEVIDLTEDNVLHYHSYLAFSADRYLYAKDAADFDVRPGMWEDRPAFTIDGLGESRSEDTESSAEDEQASAT